MSEQQIIEHIASKFTPAQIAAKQVEFLEKAAKATDHAAGMAYLAVASHTLELARLKADHRIWSNAVWDEAASH